MDLTKMINLIAEVAVKKIAEGRPQNQTKPGAVLAMLWRAAVYTQHAMRIHRLPVE